MYYVYMVRCADNTLYTGITTDLKRRVDEHNSTDKGAKYTRFKAPVVLVYQEELPDRSTASKREYEIKHMTKAQKEIMLLNLT
ncbi:MAG: GIY-YIG nuclease family protein [Weeksellaceae bacterium]